MGKLMVVPEILSAPLDILLEQLAMAGVRV